MEDNEFDPAPRRGSELPAGSRLQALADSLGCMLQADLCDLAGVKDSTAEAWAKRGEGPPYAILGNRRLYPREGVRKFLQHRLRERSNVPVGSLL